MMQAKHNLRFLLLLALISQFLGSCSNSEPISTTMAEQRDEFTFTKTKCRYAIESGLTVECGDLTVPEDYSQPDGRAIQLHVAVFRSPSTDARPDPLIYLHGGPGGGAETWVFILGHGLNRDVVIFDQRGTGHSLPRLNCPDMAGEYVDSLSKNRRTSFLSWETAHMDACRKDLEARNISLAAYSTLANAADLNILIKALGYSSVNLYGVSYGTYLALTYLREYGSEDLIRSVVLDSTYPPQGDFIAERGENAQASWDAIFSACETDPDCRQAFPDIKLRFYRLLDQLAVRPITIQKNNPYTGQTQTMTVNDFVFLEAFYRSSYRSDWIPKIPALIATVEQGDTTLLGAALSNAFDSAGSTDPGVYYSITCSNAAGQASEERIHAGNSQLDAPLRAYFNDTASGIFNLCRHWPIAPFSPTKNEPVLSSVPILLLSGAFDPSTSPAWARLAAKTLDHGYLFEFPASAHGGITNSCAQTLFFSFISNPVKPTGTCLEQLSGPTFELP